MKKRAAKKRATKKRATKLPWDELLVYDDEPEHVSFQIVFNGGDYVSELYSVNKGETAEQAAMAVCEEYDWIDNPPGDDDCE